MSQAEQNQKKENEALQSQIKELETKLENSKKELEVTKVEIPHLEALSKELDAQNKALKEEGADAVKYVECKSLDLLNQASATIEFSKTLHASFEKAKQENIELHSQQDELKEAIEKTKAAEQSIEEELQKMFQEQCDEIVKLRTEMAQLRLQTAQDKERLFGEMQGLVNSLLQSRLQLKESKECELELRNTLRDYDKKFEDLQKSLLETNTAYDGFQTEMTKVCSRTKKLEGESEEWKGKWGESNECLQAAQAEHSKLHTEITKAHEGLIKMTNLCRALQTERKELLGALKQNKE